MSAKPHEGVSATVTAAYRQDFPLLQARCARALGDSAEAEEVAQETFIRLWRSGMAPRPVSEVVPWLYRVSTRLLIDRLRTRQRRQPVERSGQVRPAHRSPCVGRSKDSEEDEYEACKRSHQDWLRLEDAAATRQF